MKGAMERACGAVGHHFRGWEYTAKWGRRSLESVCLQFDKTQIVCPTVARMDELSHPMTVFHDTPNSRDDRDKRAAQGTGLM